MSHPAPLRPSRARVAPGACLATALLFAITLGIGRDAGAVPVQPAAPDYGWLFDEGAGSTAGASFGGADGALQNGAGWSTGTPFAYGGNASLLLDGANDFVDVPGLNSVLDGATAFSISLWVRSSATGQNRAFFGGVDPSGSDTFGGRYDAAGWLNGNGGTTELIKFGLMIDGANYQYESAGGYQTTAWQHIAFTWASGAGARLYVDGVLDTPSETSTNFDTVVGALSGQTRFMIGNGAKAVWSGHLDEVMVWRSALDADEVEYLSTTTSATLVPEPSTALLLLGGLAGLAARRRDVPAAGSRPTGVAASARR